MYAKSIQDSTNKYRKFLKSPKVTKYPRFSQHIQSLWGRKSEWTHCYRTTALIRGNHTNNYAEACMRVLKELIFGRTKAYNLIQIFQFVTEIMDRYYKSNIAHTRVNRFISLRYQGLNAKQYSKDSITKLSDSTFSVPSKTERGVKYWVYMCIGQCTCPQGKDGSPCSHQAAIVLHYGSPFFDFIPVMDPTVKQKVANGEEALKDISFYCTLNQSFCNKQDLKSEDCNKQDLKSEDAEMDLSESCWKHIRVDAQNDTEGSVGSPATQSDQRTQNLDVLYKQIDSIAEDIKKRFGEESFTTSVRIFVATYYKLSVSQAMLH